MEEDREILEAFVQEAREHLDRMETDLVEFENNTSDAEIINSLFRAIHSVKGASGFFGLKTITELGHVMENMMALVREGKLTVTKEMIDALLKGSDKLREMVEDVENSLSYDVSAEIAMVSNLIDGGPAPSAETESSDTEVQSPNSKPVRGKFLGVFEPDDYLLNMALEEEHDFYDISLLLQGDIEAKEHTLLNYFKEIEPTGYYIDRYLDISSISGLSESEGQDLTCRVFFSTKLPMNFVLPTFEVHRDKVTQISADDIKAWLAGEGTEPAEEQPQPEATPAEPVKAEIDKPEPAAPEIEAAKEAAINEIKKKKSGDESIRISVSLLDDLMNLAGELVLSRNQLMRISSENATEGALPALQNINHVTSDLQEKIMQTRLQSLSTVFGKFPRIVRDLSAKLKKEISLEVTGSEVELDKSIVEALSDPLTHLIRNCADHAIEKPDDREAAGKPRSGTIHLSASHVGGQVHIEINDDGAGIDPEKIKSKAIEKGVIEEAEAAKLSDKQLINLIFAPGFSTAQEVSDVSGRGVGMDVVRTNVEKLSGSIDLDSKKGEGTKICLRLPLTLAIIPSMIVGVRNKRFAVPQGDLEEIVRLNANHKLETVHDFPVLRLRDKLLPLVDLDTMLHGEPEEDTKSSEKERYVLVLKIEQHRYGLIVEEIYENEEIVVKPLSEYLKLVECYAGSTIMGDGSIAMILDVDGIAELAKLNFSQIKENTEELDRENDADLAEKQMLLLFRNEKTEIFALNLALVSRVVKVKREEIENVGKMEYLKRDGKSLRLIRLHDYMPIKKPEEDDSEFLYIIVPKLVKHPIGIIATEVVDAIQSTVALDENSVVGDGILGSAIIDEQLTIFVDIYKLFEAADPEHYCFKEKSGGLAGKRILFAEDTAFFRSIIRQYLEDSSCVVDVANHGLEAWEKLNESGNRYDMLLTDIEMPHLNGFELSQRVRSSEEFKELPIVALTSLSEKQNLEHSKKCGINAYERKVDKEKLKSTLNSFFN